MHMVLTTALELSGDLNETSRCQFGFKSEMKQKNILVLGAKGMLGHKLCQRLSQSFETVATIRDETTDHSIERFLPAVKIVGAISVEDLSKIAVLIELFRPDVVVNCIGIVKQLAAAEDFVSSITTNALFPHKLKNICEASGARLITLSTDCIFSGKKGNYSLLDSPDPVDLYGRSKQLGEVADSTALTIRTSMIGRQLTGSHSLVEWFLAQRNKSVKGYKKALFSGLTTNVLSEVIEKIILHHPDLTGIWQVAAKPISKFDLLTLIRDIYKLEVVINPDSDYVCDRSLNGKDFSETTGIEIPSWPDMITQMFEDPTSYPCR
jgi:dTDP-4-dehydrorhamnose reductase